MIARPGVYTPMVSSAPSPWLTLAAACLGLGMLMVDMFVVVVALPAIARDLSADLAALEWTVTVYQLMLAVLPMGMGRLGAIFLRHIDAAVLPEARAAARQFLGAPGAVLEGYRGMALASALLCAAAALAAAAMGIRRGPIARDEAPGT